MIREHVNTSDSDSNIFVWNEDLNRSFRDFLPQQIHELFQRLRTKPSLLIVHLIVLILKIFT